MVIDRTAEAEAKALECVRTRGGLRKRFNQWFAIFGKPTAFGVPFEFSPAGLDLERKEWTSDCGDCVLQWRLRHRPDLPEEYSNQQTTRGVVVCQVMK